MRKYIIATAAAFGLMFATAFSASASVTHLPRVSVKVRCPDQVDTGTMWADFDRNDSTGGRRPTRGGFTEDYQFSIRQIEVIGFVGSRSYYYGPINFDPTVNAASQYIPSTTYASRSNVETEIAVRLYNNTTCVATLGSN